MSLDRVSRRAAVEHLALLGAFHTTEDDGIGTGTLVLLGPAEPGFWSHVTETPEFHDGASDPLDRWSGRVIGALAADLGAVALFPFGEPRHPFLSWAIRSGRAWASPVGLLVHDEAGLWVSYRGAILLPGRLPLPPTTACPCDTCVGSPCLTACPVGALGDDGYNLADCHAYLDTGPGDDCMSNGCAVRHACPVSQGYPRDPAQSAFHMKAFHP